MESSTKFKKADNLIFRLIGEDGIIYNPNTRQLHMLNTTALIAWNLWDGNHSLADIVDSIVSEYDADPGGVLNDVMGCADELCRQGLLNEAA